MIIIGIDPSLTSTGICVMNQRGEIKESVAIKSKHKGMERLIEIRGAILNRCLIGEKVWAFIESYSFGSKNNREALGELGGVIRVGLFENNIQYTDVSPLALKKYATGKGKGDKVAVAVAVEKGWGVDFPTTDQTDAFVLAEIGRAFHGLIPDLPKYRIEVIEKLKEGIHDE